MKLCLAYAHLIPIQIAVPILLAFKVCKQIRWSVFAEIIDSIMSTYIKAKLIAVSCPFGPALISHNNTRILGYCIV